MPSLRHEMLVELIRQRPSIATELLADVHGLAMPPHDRVLLSSSDLTVPVPTEYRADAVVPGGPAGDERRCDGGEVVWETDPLR